ncbi:hypothetical protein VNTUMSATTG_56840 (plasmid) [Vibrio nigripulchritudo]|nr:hypothetical protein VNTUMSATTG_56840 [Vibrio nigripulchritudo]
MLVTMSDKDLSRYKVINDVCERRLRRADAAEILNLSERQVQRLMNRLRESGATSLVHGARGKPSNNRISGDYRQTILTIVRKHYADFAPTLAQEKLLELHNLPVSNETLRQWMIADGLWVPHSQRQPRVYQPRYRRDCLGELVQIDGSHHDWFEGRSPKCCLLVYIDDATGRLMNLRFSDTESAFDYMVATREYIDQHGKPVAFYSDKHSIFRVNQEHSKQVGLTQFGRVLDELGIELICANSSQAKGRVERANKTLQDRLVKEMRLQGVDTIEQANAWLPYFINDFNHRFARPAHYPKDMHRRVRETAAELDDSFAWHETRKLSKSLTFQYDKVLYLIEDTEKTHVSPTKWSKYSTTLMVVLRCNMAKENWRSRPLINWRESIKLKWSTINVWVRYCGSPKRNRKNLSRRRVENGAKAAQSVQLRNALSPE